MRQVTGYAVGVRIKNGTDLIGKPIYTHTACWSDRREQPGFFLRLVGITQPAEIHDCNTTTRPKEDFAFMKEQQFA